MDLLGLTGGALVIAGSMLKLRGTIKGGGKRALDVLQPLALFLFGASATLDSALSLFATSIHGAVRAALSIVVFVAGAASAATFFFQRRIKSI